MNNVRNDALTVLFKACSLITITRSVSGIAAFSSLKQPFHVKISIHNIKTQHSVYFVAHIMDISLYMLRMLVMVRLVGG